MSRPSWLLSRLRVEYLEPRVVLSLTFGLESLEVSEHHRPGHDGGPPGGGDDDPPDEEPPAETAIDLPTVVAHEIGHALGLKHSNSPDCGEAGQPLMCAFYLGPAFELQPEDIDRINGLYPESGDPDTTNTQGRWDDTDLTYSFMPDGTDLEQQRVVGGGPPRLVVDQNTLFTTLDGIFGEGAWQGIFSDALDLWANASTQDGENTVLTFTNVSDDEEPFDQGEDGVTQGEIRFGAHTFDGPEGTLAHGYFPPPNGNTAAGDVHIDEAENWQDLRNSSLSTSTTTSANLRIPLSPNVNLLSSHPLSAASLVLGHVGGGDEGFIAVPISSSGNSQHDPSYDGHETNEPTTDDQQIGDSPLGDSIVFVQTHQVVDSAFANIGRKTGVTNRASDANFDDTDEELGELLIT